MTGYKCSTTYSYEALGRQSSVSSGPTSSADLLTSQYGYTLQQWTSSLTTELDGRTVFSETLGYDSPSSSLGGPSYTGLITRKGETWTIPTGPSPSQIQQVSRTEDYAYDYAARLSGWDDASNGENISYDARGNITSRSPRHGSGGTVTLTYTGDRLATRKVGTGTAVSFAHDSFARMTTDAESGLSITYNALDLPETVSMGNTLKAKYTYLSDGTKVSALDASGAGLVYRGPFTYRRSSGGTLAFESAPFDCGRLTEAGVRYHVTDHLGSVRAVIDGNASTTTYPLAGFYSVDDFAPFGTRSTSSASSYLSLASTGSTVSLRDGFTGQEDQLPDFSIGYSDFGARQYSPSLSRWLVPDPMGEKYYDVSPYAYCAGNPVNMVDPEGLAWVPRCDPSGELLGFDWIDDEMVAQQDGQLPEGIYHQAIYFTDNGTFNSRLRKNIGSSIAVVYLADGTIQTYDACTYPSNLSKYPTIPEGCYEASVGAHKDSYTALKMYDIGKSKDDNTIALGFVNPAYTKRTYAEGIDIHKAGLDNFTGMTQDGKPVSAGCLLIDINQWDEFIGHFKNKDQRDNKVGVIVSRSYSSPRIPNYLKYYPYKYVDGMYK